MWKEKLNDWRRHWQAKEGFHPAGLDILRYIGPGLLVTVGFIDPGNWASNFAADGAMSLGGNDASFLTSRLPRHPG